MENKGIIMNYALDNYELCFGLEEMKRGKNRKDREKGLGTSPVEKCIDFSTLPGFYEMPQRGPLFLTVSH